MSVTLKETVLIRLLMHSAQRQSANRIRLLFRDAKFMSSFIVLFMLGYWTFFTWLFHRAIVFVQFGLPGLGDLLMGRMFYLLFALTGGMLVISSAVVGYGVLFRNAETLFLQTLPLTSGQIFRWKILEASLLASWAFLFLSGPLILAYAWVMDLSAVFLIGVAVLYIPFALLANSIGILIMLILVRVWHTPWGRKGVILLSLILMGLAWWNYKTIDIMAVRETGTVPLVNLMLHNTEITTRPWIPSYWMATAVLGLGDRLWLQVFFYVAVLMSYAMTVLWLTAVYCGSLFKTNASLVQDRKLHGQDRRMRRGWVGGIGRFLIGGLFWIPRSVRGILFKDWLTFFRDTTQWAQFSIFLGLLGFYFLNIRNFKYQLDDRFWVSVIAFLNLSSLGLILSTLSTRFIFPQFSLEGRRLWILGLAPLSLKSVMWGKYWVSVVVCGSMTLFLMQFSFNSLGLKGDLRGLIAYTVILMNLGLSGIAVGTGVLFPNLKAPSAAEIVSGFGGTLCLVFSLGYVALTVLMVALPAHFRFVGGRGVGFEIASPMALVYTMVLMTSLVAAFLPMRLAEKKLDQFEM